MHTPRLTKASVDPHINGPNATSIVNRQNGNFGHAGGEDGLNAMALGGSGSRT